MVQPGRIGSVTAEEQGLWAPMIDWFFIDLIFVLIPISFSFHTGEIIKEGVGHLWGKGGLKFRSS